MKESLRWVNFERRFISKVGHYCTPIHKHRAKKAPVRSPPPGEIRGLKLLLMEVFFPDLFHRYFKNKHGNVDPRAFMDLG